MKLLVIIAAGHISHIRKFPHWLPGKQIRIAFVVALVTGCECFVIDSFSQPTFTCSKLTIETLENGVQYVQS